MRLIKFFTLVGITALAASCLKSRAESRREQLRIRRDEELDRDRWESEGGASRSGPATPSAVFERVVEG